MTRAAIYWNPEAYDTSGAALMGRHAAGEGFVRGYIRHGAADRLTLWNAPGAHTEEMEALVRRIEPSAKPIDWIDRRDLTALAGAGVLNLSGPSLHRYAWARRQFDPRAYSFCGVTHTTVTGDVMNTLNMLAIAPVEPWDALICTSRAVMASLNAQAEMLDAYLHERLRAAAPPRPQYVHIPLGVNTADFEARPADRQRWRAELGIADGDVAVLYLGRFNVTSKMNPVPMALALEQAAARSGNRVHWVLAGWAGGEAAEAAFREAVTRHCPTVTTHFIDGRAAETRRSIWAAADIFLSLSDNVQETFGLTPVEAMAAGLPGVVSDWDGYKDLLRHGVDGFRISTYTPREGLGRDLALSHSQDWTSYDGFVGGVAQFTAVDIGETVRALTELIRHPDLRARMGQAAQARARSVFDWKAIIPRYEALWAELNARRRAAAAGGLSSRSGVDNPWRPDPFRMFAAYPTRGLTPSTRLALGVAAGAEETERLMASEVARSAPALLPTPAEIEGIVGRLQDQGACTVAEVLADAPAARQAQLQRGLVWMAKYGLIAVQSAPESAKAGAIEP